MQNQTILLVEDDPGDEALTLRALRINNIGNEIIVVRDGAEALDFLFCRNTFVNRDPQVLPALILLDIKLPKIDGLEVLRRVRAEKRTQSIPIILLSSSNERKDVIEGYTSGANSYVRKPVNFTQFIEAIQQLGFYWLALNEAPPR
jgi:two-component system response regulator